MFPPNFVKENVLAFTKPGELVCDPFSGRGTTVLESLLQGRRAIGSDINPVAWCVSAAKAKPASLSELVARMEGLETEYSNVDADALRLESAGLPEFFRHAFHAETLQQILFLRSRLNREERVDRFILALVLGHLHGEVNRSQYYFSNQMPHTISTKPGYSIRYWNRNGMVAPERNVFEIVRNRAEFRLKDGLPEKSGQVALCDVRNVHRRFAKHIRQVDAVITSPPYLDVTNFEEDQWLRLWFMGGAPAPTYGKVSNDDRHSHIDAYWDFVAEAWRSVAMLLKPGGHVICRIGTGRMDIEELSDSLVESIREAWPKARLTNDPVITAIANRQTTRMNAGARGCKFEIDFTFACPC
jgi:methylase of polypeptide subunit release factors